jgi:proline iminopeptidase
VVTSLVLIAVTTTTPREVRWITEDVGRIFPAEWHRFRSFVPDRLAGRPLVDAYAELLFDPDPDVREAAAAEWCEWEASHVSLVPGYKRSKSWDDPHYRMVFARLVTHYWRHAAFLPAGQLLERAHTLNGMPGVLVHGRYDVSGPAETPWLLAREWTTAELHLIDDAGHGGSARFTEAMLDGIARMP